MLFFALLTAAAYAAPLEPAATGKMQCYAPTEHKTCASMALYTSNGDGTYANTSIILLKNAPVIIMETVTPVRIVSGAVCGTIQAEDITRARLTVNGQILTPAQAAPALAQVSAAMASIEGRDICTTYVNNGQGLTAKSTIDGTAQPSMDQAIKWVTREDGYTVAP